MFEPAIQIIGKERVCSGFLSVYRYVLRHSRFDGGWSAPLTREVVERGHAVAVLLVDDPRRQVVLVEQFRPGAMGDDPSAAWTLETAAGMIDAGETPEQAARREVREATGLEVDNLVALHRYYPSPGACSETIALYRGEVDSSRLTGQRGGADAQEDIRIRVLSFEEAFEAVARGGIRSATAIIALLELRASLER